MQRVDVEYNDSLLIALVKSIAASALVVLAVMLEPGHHHWIMHQSVEKNKG